jgi:hypothetical protein
MFNGSGGESITSYARSCRIASRFPGQQGPYVVTPFIEMTRVGTWVGHPRNFLWQASSVRMPLAIVMSQICKHTVNIA